ncbi:MAG: hypothetical protein ACE5FL_14600, partial [Myxococcota bacterium]
RINLLFHTSAQSFGQIMSTVKPQHAVADHFFNDAGTRYAIYDGIRTTASARPTTARSRWRPT